MIVGDKSSWLKMLFAFRGSSLPAIWPRVLSVTIYAIIVTAVGHYGSNEEHLYEFSLTVAPFAMIGTALAIFLGFRNNEAYNRFWEGRTLWGAIVNVSRSFTRQVLTLIHQGPGDEEPDDVDELQVKIVHTTVALVHSMRHHLRGTDPSKILQQYMTDQEVASVEQQANVPTAILLRIGEQLRDAWSAGRIHDLHLPVLEASLTEFTSCLGGCERIKSTPIPYTYNVLIHRIVTIYCFALPFGLFDTIGSVTPVVVFMISYAFFGLDAIGDEVEQPFETDDNDLPLEAICRTIEINLLEAINAPEIPEPTKPVNGVLL